MEIGCFGKLPIHSDFIRQGAFGMEISAFDQWLQEGILAAQRKFGKGGGVGVSFDKIPLWNFVFCPSGESRYLAGVWMPSRDKSGRFYPFIVFAKFEKSTLSPSMVPFLLAPFLEEAARIAKENWVGKTVRQFLDDFSTHSFPVPSFQGKEEEAYHRYLQSESHETFWVKLLGEFNHPGRAALFRNLLNLPPSTDSASYRFGLKLPFSENDLFQIPFWYDFLARLQGRAISHPTFFWSSPGGKNAALLFLGVPPPKSFLFFLDADREDESWVDLLQGSYCEGPVLFQNRECRLSDLLNEAGPVGSPR